MADTDEYKVSGHIPDYISFDYGKDYLNSRNRFQKGYTAITGEPGFFYFRVYFDWNSPLFAWSDSAPKNITAQKFLNNNRYRCGCDRRLKALKKFRHLLYFMAKDAPWAFRKVQGTGDAAFTDLAAPGKGQRSVKIEFSEEFTDFRLSLLLDLYRFICFDMEQQRVILPENLRKFNMSVMYFGVPLRWFHTPISSGSVVDTLTNAATAVKNSLLGGASKSSDSSSSESSSNTLGYQTLKTGELQVDRDSGNVTLSGQAYFQDTVSVHMLHFRNCEFVPKSTYTSFAQGDNQQPFQSTP